MPSKRDTGDGDPYSDAEEARICDAIEDAMADEYDDGETGPANAEVQVTAEIEWAGTVDKPQRSTRLDGVDMRATVKAVQHLRQAEGRDTGPLRSYKAKSWEAQLRQLNAVKRGTSAKQAAGLNPDSETLRRWKNGSQKPGKAYRERIAQAYDELRNPARGQVAKARHDVAEKFTKALRDRYGVNVRLRDIRNFRFR